MQSGAIGPARVDHERTKCESDLFFEVVGEFDHFVHRSLLGKGDKQALAPTRIGEHRSNFVGLCADGPAGDHCLQRRRRPQKRCSESGGRSVDDDQIGGLLSIELFDLAQHQQVLKAGCGGGNHIERRGRRCFTQQSADALQFEVVAERLGRRNRAAPNTTLAFERS